MCPKSFKRIVLNFGWVVWSLILLSKDFRPECGFMHQFSHNKPHFRLIALMTHCVFQSETFYNGIEIAINYDYCDMANSLFNWIWMNSFRGQEFPHGACNVYSVQSFLQKFDQKKMLPCWPGRVKKTFVDVSKVVTTSLVLKLLWRRLLPCKLCSSV